MVVNYGLQIKVKKKKKKNSYRQYDIMQENQNLKEFPISKSGE
jgi:hypothetical protein